MSNSLYSYQLNKLLVIVGPSGVGKGTLINKLLVEFPNYFMYLNAHLSIKFYYLQKKLHCL